MSAGIEANLRATNGRLEINIRFKIDTETLVIAGPNGAGKTSVLSLLLGLRPVIAGRILVANTPLLDTEQAIAVPIERRNLGYLPQNYGLLPHLNVREQIQFALGCKDPPGSQTALHEEVEGTLRAFELLHLATQTPKRLSGGEQQRVALARALCVKPRALLLDEPLAALDVAARRKLRAYLRTTLKAASLPTLLVTHDPLDAETLGDRILILEAGQVTQSGTWQELKAQPATPFIREFTGTGR
jgi:molybdate transport system ATP-binding protein